MQVNNLIDIKLVRLIVMGILDHNLVDMNDGVIWTTQLLPDQMSQTIGGDVFLSEPTSTQIAEKIHRCFERVTKVGIGATHSS